MAEKMDFTTDLVPMTGIDLVRSIAWQNGKDISSQDADYLLWNHTGFPAFFDGEPIECICRDINAYFQIGPACAGCGVRPVCDGDYLCESCASKYDAVPRKEYVS